jgi:DNA primase
LYATGRFSISSVGNFQEIVIKMSEAPKYLTLRNPEKKTKRAAFFGEDTVKRTEALLITEGPIDAAHANQVGHSAIATRGLHVSKHDLPHLVNLCRKARSVFLVFDAESAGAGARGAAALGEKLWNHGIPVRIAQLPLAKNKEKIDLAEFYPNARQRR